jgi:hypothetical protein
MTPDGVAIVAELSAIEAQLTALTDRVDFLEIAIVTVAALLFGLLVSSVLRSGR